MPATASDLGIETKPTKRYVQVSLQENISLVCTGIIWKNQEKIMIITIE